MVSTFHTNVLCVEAKYTLAELDYTRKYPGEDLDLYVKTFHEKVVDCHNPLEEEVLETTLSF